MAELSEKYFCFREEERACEPVGSAFSPWRGDDSRYAEHSPLVTQYRRIFFQCCSFLHRKRALKTWTSGEDKEEGIACWHHYKKGAAEPPLRHSRPALSCSRTPDGRPVVSTTTYCLMFPIKPLLIAMNTSIVLRFWIVKTPASITVERGGTSHAIVISDGSRIVGKRGTRSCTIAGSSSMALIEVADAAP